jgi:OOP family OmpA-OmpF porin
MPDSRLVPYVAAGLGGITLEDNPDGSNTNPLYNYGGGVKYFLNDNVALRGDVRHMVTFDDHYNNLVYAVGLTFQFPTKQEVVPVAAPPEPEPAPVVKKAPEPKPVPPPPPVMEEIVVSLNIQFDFDKYNIKTIYEDDCKRIANFLKQFPDKTIEIDGHTDSMGDPEYNMKLSQRRADNAREHLIKNYGIDPQRITAKGFGETRPVASNDTEQGRQQNRRVVAVAKAIVEVK